MSGFQLELKHGIRLAFHGKSFDLLIETLEQIRRDATEGRAAEVYGIYGGFCIRLARKKGEPAPTNAEWLDLVNDIQPIVRRVKQRRGGVKALHDALLAD